MVKKERQANLSYCYDRLWEQKLAQVYQLLVPERQGTASASNIKQPIIEDQVYEDSSHIYAGILRSAEGE
jgi:hypothetical protein